MDRNSIIELWIMYGSERRDRRHYGAILGEYDYWGKDQDLEVKAREWNKRRLAEWARKYEKIVEKTRERLLK